MKWPEISLFYFLRQKNVPEVEGYRTCRGVVLANMLAYSGNIVFGTFIIETRSNTLKNRELKQQRQQRLRKRYLKMKSRCFKVYRPYSISFIFVKCWQFFLELNFKRLYQCSGKVIESRCLVFTSSKKRDEIRQFHVVVVQWRPNYVQKSVMQVQSCCFASLNQLLFCRSCWRRRRCLIKLPNVKIQVL